MLKLVFVDDEKGLCQAYEDLYESSEMSVKAFFDVQKAKAYIDSNEVDLVFIDYRMPKISGPQFRKMLDTNLKCVMVTGEFVEDIEDGFVDLLRKPFEDDEFLAIVSKHT